MDGSAKRQLRLEVRVLNPVEARPRADDPNAIRRERFEGLFARESRVILGYALRRVGSAEDAADVVADTFLVAWRRIDDVPLGDEARIWLYGVARKVLANQRRGVRRRRQLGERLRWELATQVEPGPADRSDDAALVRAAMVRLDERDRELLQLTSWEGLTPIELAEVLSVPAGTVRSRLHRARKRLRAELEALGWIGGERIELTGHEVGDGRAPVRRKEDA